MRILKILFSRTILVFLAFLVQFGALFYLAIVPSKYFYIVQSISVILSFVAICHMISKKQCAEFKLPWLLLLLVFPITGLLLYLIFANRKLSRKQIRRMRKIKLDMKNAQIYSHEQRAVKDFLAEDFFLEKYLVSCTDTRGQLNNRISYFSCGEDFFEDLKNSLYHAQNFIFLEYFIIAYGKVWDEIHTILKEKVRGGVEVRIIYDDIGSLGRVNVKFYKKLRKEGIQCVKFNPFRPIMSGIHNNRDHRKIAVIDGVIGYTGGINVADEYANITHLHGHWKDSAIKIQGSAVVNLTAMFLEMYDAATKQTSDYKKFLHIPAERYEDEGFVHFFGDAPSPFDTELVGEGNFINILDCAKKYVYITTPYIVIDYTLTTALRNASLRGVDVRIITPHIPDKKIVFNVTRSHYKTLMEAGVKIYEYTPGFMHAKTVIADDKVAFVGTINFDYRSLAHHFECGAVLYKTPCIKDIKLDIDQTLEVSQQITSENFKMNKFVSIINSILAIFFPML